MRRPEQALQRSVIQYLDAVLPTEAWAFHVPNGGGRSKAEASIFKALGVRPGIPDLCIIWQGKTHWIELKAGRGRTSEAQQAAHLRLQGCGCWPVATCRSIDDIKAALRVYGIPTREARRAA